MPTELARWPAWLYQALGVRDPQLPAFIDVDAMTLIVDAYQGGWGLSTWTTNIWVAPVSAVAQSNDFIPGGEPDYQHVVWHPLFHNASPGSAGQHRMDMLIRDPATATIREALSATVPINTMAASNGWTGEGIGSSMGLGVERIHIPPNFGARWAIDPTVAGEQPFFACTIQRLPAGFKAW